MKKRSLILHTLKWLDDNLLSFLAGFLLVFIPLYPKIPLLDAIPGYIVRIRIEDLLISLTCLIFFIWVIRGKIKLQSIPLFKPVIIYLAIGFISMLSAVFIVKTVPLELLHVGKMVLHYFRRIEYFSLFFILYSAIKTPKQVKIFTFLILFSIIGVSIYGFGQKYLYWPAFSTMNREFAKGWLLYLTEHSRVLSTFGGHYDLAAYIMMMLTFLWSLFFGVKSKIGRFLIFSVIAAAFWILILTASRTSFIAYIGSTSLIILLWIFRRNISWVFTRWFGVMVLSLFVMLSFGDLSERFTKLLKLNQRFGGLKNILLQPATKPPEDKAYFLVNNLEAVTSKSDQPPTPLKPGERPVDVEKDIPDVVSSGTGEITFKPRTYSETALKYDLSTGIRFDALWPRAIAGFLKNPLLGSGYSTLTKTQVEEFTEAESTDNDYLRMLGETGLLGALSFLGILGVSVFLIWKSLSGVKSPWLYALFVSAIGLTFGLLINAVYIDVFEASKVAYSYWAFMGLVLGAININKKEIEKHKEPLEIKIDWQGFVRSFKEGIKSDRFVLLIILLLAFYLRLYKIDNPVVDWHSWRQADTAAVTRNFDKRGINLLYPTFDDLSSIPSGLQNPKGLRMVEFPIYNAISIFVKRLIPEGPLERSMRLTSIFASLGTIIYLFLLTRKIAGRKIAFLTAGVFSILPYNIFYGRAILPEPFMVFTSIGFLYYFYRLVEVDKNKGNLKDILEFSFLTVIFGASALLVKPYAVFLMLPSVFFLIQAFYFKLIFKKKYYLILLLILMPIIFWRLWINNFPEGIPAYGWLFNGDNIRFKGAFFYWLFAERISKLILGYWGLVFLILGLLARTRTKGEIFFKFFFVSSIIYLFILATGNVRHDYYQILLTPSIAVMVAYGIDFIITGAAKYFFRITAYLIIFLCLIFMEAFGWYQIRDFFNINHPEIVQAGQAVDRLTRRNGLVIAPYMGDTAFLYQTNRAGWPIIEESVENLTAKGADYYVSVNFDDVTNDLIKKAENSYSGISILEKNPQYVIIQLVPNSKLPKD